MSETKTRYYVTPSSLGSYFGVGFNTPEAQFDVDRGTTTFDFDDDSVLRLELGKHLEGSVTDFFQDVVFKVPITDRNEEVKWGYNNKIKYQLDGKMMLDKPTIFENKISNSKSYKFTENLGYHIQVQAYMLCEDVEQAVLAGLYQGRPIYKIIKRDEELIEDIKRMTDFLVDALSGFVDFYEDYPVDILDKYSKTKIFEPIDNLSSVTLGYLKELAILNEEKNAIEKKIKELNKLHEEDFEITEGTFDNDELKVIVTRFIRPGGFDVDKFKLDFPDLDLSKYNKEDIPITRRVIKLKEPRM